MAQPVDQMIQREAGRVAASLAVAMKRARMAEIHPGRSRFAAVRVSGDGLRCQWASNGASVDPATNFTVATEFFRIYPELARDVKRAVSTMEIAERWSPSLAARMVAVGLTDLDCPRGSGLTAAQVSTRGGVPHLECTWRSNGATVSAVGNQSIASAFVSAINHLDRLVTRRERQLGRMLASAREL